MSLDSAIPRDHHSWWSPRLQKHMPIVRYGHWGPAMLLFPTWVSDLWEPEQRGLLQVIARPLLEGRLNVFCVDSITTQAWCSDVATMEEKSRLQAAYSGYVEEEVAPHIQRILHDPAARILAVGASFGAFFASNAAFRRPDLFWGMIGMSGFYGLDKLVHGYTDEQIYLNSPAWFVPHLPEGPQLDLLRNNSRIFLLSGRGQWEYPEETERFARVLREKRIPHECEIWGPEMAHDWPTWQRMLDVVIRERLKL